MGCLMAVGPVGGGGSRWATGNRTVTKAVGGRLNALWSVTDPPMPVKPRKVVKMELKTKKRWVFKNA